MFATTAAGAAAGVGGVGEANDGNTSRLKWLPFVWILDNDISQNSALFKFTLVIKLTSLLQSVQIHHHYHADINFLIR